MSHSVENLNGKTNVELRKICADLGIPGVSKKPKTFLIEAIMAKSGFSAGDLENKTNPELRAMCAKEGIGGVSKKTKAELIALIVGAQGQGGVSMAPKATAHQAVNQAVTGLEMNTEAVLTRPHGRAGDKTTQTIRISSGASSGKFPVLGKTVGNVATFLREVLNVDRMAQGLVNGQKVQDSYVLAEGDVLEYIKPAGRKG